MDKKSKLLKSENILYNLQIWDTAGQEVYQSITKSYYKKSDGLILLFDVTEEGTFFKVEKWLKEIEANANENTLVYLVGNKIDCVKERKVEYEKAENIAKSLNKKFFEIAARLGINVKETVFNMVKEILSKKKFDSVDRVILKNNKTKNKKKNCCASKKS